MDKTLAQLEEEFLKLMAIHAEQMRRTEREFRMADLKFVKGSPTEAPTREKSNDDR